MLYSRKKDVQGRKIWSCIYNQNVEDSQRGITFNYGRRRFWVQCGIPNLTEKIAENLVSVEVDIEFKQVMSARVLFCGIINEDGEVWIARQSAMKEKPVKIFPVEK